MTNAKDLAARMRELTRITGYATTKEAADLIEQQENELRVLRIGDSLHKIAIKERNTAWAEIERLRAAIDAAMKGTT